MIDKIILKLLNECGFDGYEKIQCDYVDTCFFTYRKVRSKVEYYIVSLINQKQFIQLDEKLFVSNLSNQLKNMDIYNSEIDKNTSLIIAVAKERNSAFDELLELKVLQVEENPYFFKKYVITYNIDLTKKISERINDKSSIISEINKVLMNSEKFRNFKLDTANNEEYEFLASLIIKLPIVPITTPNNSNIESIDNRVYRNLDKVNLIKIEALIEEIDNFNDEKDDKELLKTIEDFWIGD